MMAPGRRAWRRRWLTGLLCLACAPAWAATVKCLSVNGKPYVQYDGGVKAGDADALRQTMNECFPASRPGTAELWLRSPGGSVDEGLKMAAFIRTWSARRGLRVRVAVADQASYCISACTFLFVAGGLREVPPGSSFEPHGFSGWKGPKLDAVEKWTDSEPNVFRLSKAIALLGSRLPSAGYEAPGYLELFNALQEDDISPAAVQAQFQKIPQPFRELLVEWDGLLGVWIPELERRVAFRRLMERAGVQGADLPVEVSAETFELSPPMMDRVIAKQLAKSRLPWRPSATADPGLTLTDLVRAQIESSKRTANRLWDEVLGHAESEFARAGLIRLMFSTSIIYTRQLTREELCDTNIVNIGC